MNLEGKHTIEEYEKEIKLDFSVQIVATVKRNQKFVKLYSLCTLICILVDALCFCVAYRWFIEGTADHANVWMLFAFTGMLVYDTIHIFYMLTLRRSMPSHVSKWIWEAVFGDVKNLEIALKTFQNDV